MLAFCACRANTNGRQADRFFGRRNAVKRFFVFSAAAILLGTLGILKADETPTAGDFRSYTQGFAPQLGGVYRNPDAYLPYYPGYAPIGDLRRRILTHIRVFIILMGSIRVRLICLAANAADSDPGSIPRGVNRPAAQDSRAGGTPAPRFILFPGFSLPASPIGFSNRRVEVEDLSRRPDAYSSEFARGRERCLNARRLF